MVLVTAAGGMRLAPGHLALSTFAYTLLGMALIVSAANSFNCWLERDLDRLMTRTRERPLPAQRMEPRTAVWFGAALAVLALPILWFGVNPLTALLGAGAFASYVAIYTPLKTLTPAALLVGAVPGALPPLMGWTAATGSFGAPGLAVFGILFLWQLPHFIAIASFRREEYEAAGMRVLPAVRGDFVARIHATFWAALLVPVSVLPVWLGVAGWAYGAIALVSGVAFFAVTASGVRRNAAPAWARRVFVASLLYLPLVFAALMLNAR